MRINPTLKGLTMSTPNEIIQKKPIYAFLLFLALFLANQFTVYNGNQKVDALSAKIEALEVTINLLRYEPSEQTITKAFSDLIGKDALIDKVQSWIDNEWTAKLVDINKLCNQPNRSIINNMIGQSIAIDICRMAQ
jgi:hypothetical protein